MQKFTVSVYINCSQQDVFDFLSNAANFQRWMPHMQSAAWTSSSQPGVGTTGRGVMKMAGREMELLLEITRWDAPNRVGFKILNVSFPSRSKKVALIDMTSLIHPDRLFATRPSAL